MSNILFCGDTHGKFAHIVEAVQQLQPDAIVLLGDVQARQPLHIELEAILASTEIWFIHGNHDTDTDADYDNLFHSSLAAHNLHGRVAEVAGVRIAGLGGIFRGRIWSPPSSGVYATPEEYIAQGLRGKLWRNGLPRKHYSSIFPQDYQQLAQQQADVLVTHEAPSCHPHGFSAIDHLARNLGVKQSFHGHQHDNIDYRPQRERLGWDAYGVGLRGITDLAGRVIRAGELDGAALSRPAHR